MAKKKYLNNKDKKIITMQNNSKTNFYEESDNSVLFVSTRRKIRLTLRRKVAYCVALDGTADEKIVSSEY